MQEIEINNVDDLLELLCKITVQELDSDDDAVFELSAPDKTRLKTAYLNYEAVSYYRNKVSEEFSDSDDVIILLDNLIEKLQKEYKDIEEELYRKYIPDDSKVN